MKDVLLQYTFMHFILFTLLSSSSYLVKYSLQLVDCSEFDGQKKKKKKNQTKRGELVKGNVKLFVASDISKKLHHKVLQYLTQVHHPYI